MSHLRHTRIPISKATLKEWIAEFRKELGEIAYPGESEAKLWRNAGYSPSEAAATFKESIGELR